MSILNFKKIISDLHVHSLHSDGTFGFKKILDLAKAAGLQYISITDHDSIDAYKEPFFLDSCADNLMCCNFPDFEGLKVIPGIEFSTMDIPEKGFFDIHILGYNIDFLNVRLNSELEKINLSRIDQKKEVIRILRQDYGFDITFEEVQKRANGIIGKPHIVETLLDKKGSSGADRLKDKENLYRLIGEKVNIPKSYLLSIKESIDLIHECGGLAVLAHPGIYKKDIQVIDYALNMGIDGVEVYYAYDFSPFQDNIRPETSGNLILKYENHIKENHIKENYFNKNGTIRPEKIILTGGSDFHGTIKQIDLGDGGLNRSLTDLLIEALRLKCIHQGGN